VEVFCEVDVMIDTLKVAIVEHNFTLACKEASELVKRGLTNDIISALIDMYSTMYIDRNMYIAHLIHDRIKIIQQNMNKPKTITFLQGCGILEICCLLTSKVSNPKDIQQLKYENKVTIRPHRRKISSCNNLIRNEIEDFSVRMGFDCNLIHDMISFAEDIFTMNVDTIKFAIMNFLRKYKTIKNDIIHNVNTGIQNSQKKDSIWLLWIICILISKQKSQTLYITNCMLELFKWKYKRTCRETRMNLLLFSFYNTTFGLSFELEYNIRLLLQSYTKGPLLYDFDFEVDDDVDLVQKQKQEQQLALATSVSATTELMSEDVDEEVMEIDDVELGNHPPHPLFIILERDEVAIKEANEKRIAISEKIRANNKIVKISVKEKMI
jgi:hypothetical protein